ncbi:hematopoietic death receptor isoform X1 [Anguilla anguilla]|uniref:hematopoietic death receptor isoform X1 n=1 Tax=Anguilla anguilla TaxID=7936 RepID=UPI0015AEFD15|nr:hematopoietic death receptor isoform X1 [Anguilla anguilla]
MKQCWNYYFQFRMSVLKSVSFFICALSLVVAVKPNVRTLRSTDRNRLTREIYCRENLEYPHKSLCCLNCPAGQHVKSSCERAGERGICSACEYGTFTEHPNGLDRCFLCTKCRKDQEVTGVCTSTKDTECQCKAGTFCGTEQACEVCKKCTKCKEDEEVVRNCTTTSNSVCQKKPPSSNSGSTSPVVASVIVPLLLFVLLVIAVAIGFFYQKRALKKPTENCSHPDEEVNIHVDEDCERTMEEQQNRQNAGREEPEQQPFLQGIMLVGAQPSATDEEDKGLGDSLPNTTSSSQTSLSTQPTALPSKSPNPSPKTQRQPIIRENGCCRRLIPVNGEDSLLKAFDIIEKNLNCIYRNRFFRLIGLSDNTINNPEFSFSGDRVYKLLKSWMEKEGLKADINDLIQALLQLDQRYSAEIVIQEVIDHGYFRFQDES